MYMLGYLNDFFEDVVNFKSNIWWCSMLNMLIMLMNLNVD